jgi:hypothetical protein
MATIQSFIRNTPRASLRAYFDHANIPLTPPVNWDGPDDVIRPLLQAVDQMDDVARARVVNDAERVSAMADEAGQAAIYSVAPAPDALDDLQNAHARSLWMFLREPVAFRHAEEVRFTDERRRGRMWDGFMSEPNLTVRRDIGSVEAFKAAIRERFSSRNAHVDIFDRHRPMFEGDDCALVQASVYREGRLDDALEFVDGALDRRPRRPVLEAALTYEPAVGAIEVVGPDRESREDLVRCFARDLLATEFRHERLPLRQFYLGVLLRPFEFPTDPEDGIEAVRVNHLRLMPLETTGERVTLECMRQSTRSIWQMAQERFGMTNPLNSGWVVTQAKLTIRFHPEAGARRGKTLPVTITMPHGSDLKDRTDRERIVGERYLRRWGILRDV